MEPARRVATFSAIALIYLALPNIYPGFMSPNEYSRLWLTRAIVEQHSLRIDRYVGNRSPNAVADIAYSGGHFYTDKAIGMSFAAVLPIAVLQAVVPNASDRAMLFVARFFTVTIPALVALWIVIQRCRTNLALLAVTALALGSVVFSQALGLTGHLPMTILICSAAALASRADPPAALIGAMLGAAILIDFTSAIAAAGLLVVIAFKTRSLRKVIVLSACCAALASIQLYVNARCFDGPLDFAYHHEYNPIDRANRSGQLFGIGVPRLEAVSGLTFGMMQGMFTHSPFLLFAIPAIARRQRDPMRIWAIAMCAAYFYLNCTLPDWEGGWALGPRYLTLVYVLLTWLLVDWIEPRLFALAATWSVLLYLASMLTWSMPPQWKDLTFPSLQLSSYLMFRSIFAPNALAWIGAPAMAVLAFSIAIVVIALGLIIVNAGRRTIPYVAAAILLFTIAIARAAPPYDSPIAKEFEIFARYMGH